jgi:hypothetical protein
VLEDGQPRHQSRRQRRVAGIIRVDFAEAPFQEPPVHRPPQRYQRMLHVDDLIEPRAKQILLARLAPFPWPHPNLRSSIAWSKESRLPIRRNPSFDFARKSTATPGIPAKSIAAIPKIILQPQTIRDSSRKTT